jgi:hypothetical protein
LAAGQSWGPTDLERVANLLPKLDLMLDQAERSANEASDLRSALSLVVDLESSEINEVFAASVSSTRHLRFTEKILRKLDPELAIRAAERFRAGHGALKKG